MNDGNERYNMRQVEHERERESVPRGNIDSKIILVLPFPLERV